jgi:uncharacterized protein (TIGR00369 family)
MDKSALTQFFEQGIAFNRHLGMRIVELESERVSVCVPFRPELVGDPFRPALHGGVLSTLADTAGGLAVFAKIGSVHARISTVDLRIDYYAPAAMEDLLAIATVARMGNRVGVARIDIRQGEVLVAEGKGVYNIRTARSAPS